MKIFESHFLTVTTTIIAPYICIKVLLFMPKESKTLTQLADEYRVHRNTMRRWLIPILPELNVPKRRRLFLPWQVKIIYKFLERPSFSKKKK